tara:strand:- start:3195 stop:3824 length:630 start_codon:yes stop_codon:yes gene_type:complete
MILLKGLGSLKIKNNLTYKEEIFRKLLHLFDSIIPLSLFFLERDFIINLLIPTTFIFISLDFLRHQISSLNKIYLYFFSKITRNIEKDNNTLTGASYYLLGCSIVFLLFDNNNLIVASLLIMTISDSFAAIVGIKYGRTKIYNNSSLEGSFAFFISTLIILNIFIPTLNVINIIIIAVLVTTVELVSSHNINDNLTIPISSAILISLFI